METLSDIVAIMRRGTKLPGYWRSCDLNKILAYHADRIEAAWKREKSEIEANALAVGGVVEAIREYSIRQRLEELRVALSAPARQCDVGTAEEQYRRWVRFCEQRLHRCDNCPCVRPEGCTFTFENMPYEAEEGAGG